jgi:hypothetical protein
VSLHPIDLKLAKRIADEITGLERDQIEPMVNGMLKDFEQYQWAVGYLKALEHVRAKLKDIQDEDDDAIDRPER